MPRRLAGGAAGRVGVGACASDLYETRERCVSDLYRGVGADEGEMCVRFVPGSWGGGEMCVRFVPGSWGGAVGGGGSHRVGVQRAQLHGCSATRHCRSCAARGNSEMRLQTAPMEPKIKSEGAAGARAVHACSVAGAGAAADARLRGGRLLDMNGSDGGALAAAACARLGAGRTAAASAAGQRGSSTASSSSQTKYAALLCRDQPPPRGSPTDVNAAARRRARRAACPISTG